jgi:hypothetical protein
MKKQDADPALDRLLHSYRLPLERGEDAIAHMVRAARVRAVQMQQEWEQRGFFGLVAHAFGFTRTAPVIWSTAGGIAVSLLLGVSLGASNTIPITDEQAFSIDFDSVLGASTLAAGQDLPL